MTSTKYESYSSCLQCGDKVIVMPNPRKKSGYDFYEPDHSVYTLQYSKDRGRWERVIEHTPKSHSCDARLLRERCNQIMIALERAGKATVISIFQDERYKITKPYEAKCPKCDAVPGDKCKSQQKGKAYGTETKWAHKEREAQSLDDRGYEEIFYPRTMCRIIKKKDVVLP